MILAWREARSRAHSSRSRRSSFGEDIADGAIGGEEGRVRWVSNGGEVKAHRDAIAS